MGQRILWGAGGLIALLAIGFVIPTLGSDGADELSGAEAAFGAYALEAAEDFYASAIEGVIVRRVQLESVEPIAPGEPVGVVFRDGELVEGTAPGEDFACTGPPHNVTGYYRAEVSGITLFGFRYGSVVVTCEYVRSE